jgi:hypothetical protein
MVRQMIRGQSRINVSLEPEYAEKLAILAERAHVQEGTLARSLLSQAIDEADINAQSVVEILDGIPGAFERAERGIAELHGGRGIPLDQI